MNIKLVNFILIAIYFTIVSSLTIDEYFEKSFLKSLKEKNGQITIESDEYFMNSNNSDSRFKYKEIYNYKNSIGNLTTSYISKMKNNIYFTYFKLYSNIIIGSNKKDKEIYSFTNLTDTNCFNLNPKYVTINYLLYNSVKVFPEDRNYNFLGPITLVEELIFNYKKDKDSIQCSDIDQNKKCNLNIGDRTKLEYFLKTQNDQTLYPIKIIIYSKNRTSDEFIKDFEFIFTKIDIKYDVEESSDFVLPIGIGCQRSEELHKHYPQIETKYGSKFKIENEIKFDYLDAANRKFSRNNEEKNYLTRTYANKIYANTDKLTYTADTIDEFTNQSIKLIYKTDTNTVYKINLKDNQCLTYDLENNRSYNYFYILDIIVNEPYLFNTYNNYTFLGNYRLNDNKNYLVFEKLFKKSIEKTNSYQEFKEALYKNAVDEGNEPFKNKNRILARNIIATHYYLESDYASKKENIVPSKIQLIFKDFFKIYGNMTIDLKLFESNLDGHQSYDTSKCSKS